jgi:opacity protein-like surface antigen
MNPVSRTALALMICLPCLGGAAAGQSQQKLSLQGSGAVLFATQSDPSFTSSTRLGYEAQLRYTVSRFSMGAGYQRSTVFKFPNGESIALSLGFVEPRLVLTAGSGVAAYVAGRLGLGTLTCTETCNAGGTNITYGGGGGLLFKLNKRLSADLGGQFFQVSGKLSSGYAMVRAGLGIGL